MKSLHEYLVEADNEEVLVVKAAVDIHTKTMLAAITNALAKYSLRALEPAGRSMLKQNPREFPDVHAAEVYTVEATLGIMPDCANVADEIAMHTAIPAKLLCCYPKGNEPEENAPEAERELDPLLGTAPGEHGSEKGDSDAQELVGQKRIEALMREIEEEDIKARAKKIEAIRKFVMSHLGLKEHAGQDRRKGFYICEARDGQIAILEGPFDRVPPDMDLVSTSTTYSKALGK
jgi:hypothetical protein